jgi:hypothetical protein
MFFFPVFKHGQTMLETGIALQLAIGADFRALHKVFGVLVFARRRLQGKGDKP